MKWSERPILMEMDKLIMKNSSRWWRLVNKCTVVMETTAKKNGRKTKKDNKAATKESYKQQITLDNWANEFWKGQNFTRFNTTIAAITSITQQNLPTYNNCKRTKFIFCHYSNCFCPFTLHWCAAKIHKCVPPLDDVISHRLNANSNKFSLNSLCCMNDVIHDPE